VFARRPLKLPDRTGDWGKDGESLYKALTDYLRSLEQPGTLAIIKPEVWTPTLTFATPGDLAVGYTTRVGDLLLHDWGVQGNFRIVTSSFTHTTAAGNLQVTGFPYTPSSDTGFVWDGVCPFSGINFAGAHTQMVCSLTAGSPTILFSKSGDNVAGANVDAGDVPTGGSVVLRGSFWFRF
jgi:hypothetical protein